MIDVYYLLWRVAQHINDPGLSRALSANAIILNRFLNQGGVNFNQLNQQIAEREALLGSLGHLQQALSNGDVDGSIAEMLTQFVFDDLYNSVHATALNAFTQQLTAGNSNAQATRTLTFLYEIAQVVSERFNGSYSVNGNNLAYARSRAWYFLFHQLGYGERSPT
ncbi:hypothetical protein GZ77_10495 [Endozoicomonas montiporae]|uniref:Uncharacterized protein n=2 Tax=Endozoicomonas montiporae TaxID=1027273 RepID=A0A081N8F3_9GAMM|nr:hypothetical protein [Endozoicomonas montiporae]AMO55383.1 hypothetical protein EZMO1_1188 [Endozoicomonas montiporae CL-33]KEQ14726.1 hypothetical protein GZ77_10495 [Endozoicomonas montiporae]